MPNKPSALPPRPSWVVPVAAAALVFGLLSIVSGGRVLFGDDAARAAAGDTVSFVLRFNIVAGFAYAIAAVGLWRWRRWSARLALGIALATVAVFAAFGWHVASGGAFELRTVAAMALRSVFWVAIAAVACRGLGCGRTGSPQT